MLPRFIVFAALVAITTSTQARSLPEGCRPAVLQEIKDGDTIRVFYQTSEKSVWIRTLVRIRGIDAPEHKGKAKCDFERSLAGDAVRYLTDHLGPFIAKQSAFDVVVCKPKLGKFGGRRIADVQFKKRGKWHDVATLMLDAGYAFGNYKGGKRASWCACLEEGECPNGYLD